MCTPSACRQARGEGTDVRPPRRVYHDAGAGGAADAYETPARTPRPLHTRHTRRLCPRPYIQEQKRPEILINWS